MSIVGANFIGNKVSMEGNSTFKAYSPLSGDFLPGDFHTANEEEFEQAVQLSETAFKQYRNISAASRSDFLEAIAEEIMNLGNELIDRCVLESGLPEGRIIGERGRTCGQLRLFAELLRAGWCFDARIDTAMPDRSPVPRPDIRRMLIPLGPVAVYGVSNFPLAFSTAGGDTASALAAGCTVVFKAHPSHPGTNSLVSFAIIKAAERTGMPEGVFSSLNLDNEHSISLTKHSLIKAVGFTGSRTVGMLLYHAAVNRAEPIPVYAEMSSINPFIILNGAIERRQGEIAKGLAVSLTLGAGQFCTNPGLVLITEGQAAQGFIEEFAGQLRLMVPAVMLNKNICANYGYKIEQMQKIGGVRVVAQSDTAPASESDQARPVAFTIKGDDFLVNELVKEEIFGPATLIVVSKDTDQLRHILESLEGQLTTSVHADASEVEETGKITEIISRKAGRLIFNEYPTGVEVSHAMQHGGPFPSTTDSRSTSVGSSAISRFLRPVAYQDYPETLLPDALKSDNPLGIYRLVNGRWDEGALKL